MKRALLSITVLLSLASCTDIVEGSIRSSLVGEWEAYLVEDVNTGEIDNKDDGDLILVLFEDSFCDAIQLSDDGSFRTFYHNSTVLDDENGLWEYAFLDLTLSFNDGNTLVRNVSINEDELTLPDTIAGNPKVVTFRRI